MNGPESNLGHVSDAADRAYLASINDGDVCDHCALPVERATLAINGGNPMVWWAVVGERYPGGGRSIHCHVRQGRHTVNGVPLGEYIARCDEKIGSL